MLKGAGLAAAFLQEDASPGAAERQVELRGGQSSGLRKSAKITGQFRFPGSFQLPSSQPRDPLPPLPPALPQVVTPAGSQQQQ